MVTEEQERIEKNWKKWLRECAILHEKTEEDLKFVDFPVNNHGNNNITN